MPLRLSAVSLPLVATALAVLAAGCNVDPGTGGSTSASLTVCPATNVVADPPQFVWEYHAASASNPTPYYSGTLEMAEASFVIGGQTLTTRAYRQAGTAASIPGPTIRMKPGNKYVLRFHNTLPYAPMSTDMNVFKDANVSNVHTHGLHISGESPSDDVTRAFEGGTGGDFVWDLPANHMGGTYWYHAHHHGSTYLQVSGGAFGQIVIDDSNDGVPANVAAMPERQLVVAYLDPSVKGTSGDSLMSGTLQPTWTVNGLVQGALCAPAGEWQHWRVLLADRSATDKTFAVGANCEIALLARDGVWRTTAPKLLSTSATSGGSIVLTGASRADFAVRCTNDSVITVNGTTVANVYVNGAGNTTVGPFSNGSSGSTWSAIRPAYLADLRSVGSANLHAETIRMGARTLNGTKFNHDVPNLSLAADKVQEWSVSGNTQHPFHLHVYHFQAQNCSGSFENGEYYDTLTSSCTVRFDMRASTGVAYEGRTIMHCHILDHEDQGAMGWMDVLGGLPPPTFPADANATYATYYSLGQPAPVCGDLACNGSETVCSCSGDCGPAPTTETACGNGTDDDCDGQIDCNDPDCSAAAGCAVSGCDGDGICEAGETCSTCASDCAGVTGGQPSKRYCCGDGTKQAAEGDGSICNGNY